ncbi:MULTISPECIES: tetratricopeptide repeat protein [Acidobacterium]|uniref:tetratricopeptide repeat protein n=1 Tax=Acidobacterium TaxID=33973 RepID=UPI00030ADC88|nr:MULTISPECIES: tetratricopeptide repeat protein [Acidobacterium]HCT61259.1 tetratricopeptide repeat protein [Acidobacterium sp.]
MQLFRLKAICVGLLLAGLSLAFAVPEARAQSAASPDLLRQQALALEQQGQFAQAESIWHTLLTQNAKNVEACAHLGLDEARTQNYPEAIQYYRRALALDPSLHGLRLDLALSYFKMGKFPQAIPLLAEELHQHPGDLRLTILLGMAHYGAQQYDKVVPYLKAAAAKEPQSAAIRLPLAQACLWSRQFECVLTTYKQILALNADSAEADMLAGEAYSAQSNTPAAIRQFRAAIQANPNLPQEHFGLGYLLWTQRNYAEAEEQFRDELRISPDDGQSLAYLGDTLMHLGKSDEARASLERAMVLKSSLELAHLDLGILDVNAGHDSAAVAEFHAAIQINPKSTDARWRLARLYQKMGQHQKAAAEFAIVSKMKRESAQSLYLKMAGSHEAQATARQKDATPQ